MKITKYDVENNSKGLPMLVKEESTNYTLSNTLKSPDEIVQMLNTVFRMDKKAEEHVYVIGFNSKLHPIAVFELSKGTINQSLVGCRELFMRLLLCGATSFVFTHNHPSGDPFPSTEDFKTLNRLKSSAELMGISFLDSIIIGDGRYFSSKTEKCM